MVSRSSDGTLAPIARKDSSLSNRMTSTFAGSLRHLFLADNRLQDEAFEELALLPELVVHLPPLLQEFENDGLVLHGSLLLFQGVIGLVAQY